MISFIAAHRKPVFLGSLAAQWGLAVLLALAWWPHLRPLLVPSPLGLAAGAVLGALLVVLRRRAVPVLHPLRWRARPIATKALLLGASAVAEEIIWRGIGLFWLASVVTPVAAVIVTTLGFAAAHVFAQGWRGFRAHLITGLVLAVPALLLGSLLVPIIAHLAYNWTLVTFDEEARAERARIAAPPLRMMVAP